jgi:AraC-like DNA-binding protein
MNKYKEPPTLSNLSRIVNMLPIVFKDIPISRENRQPVTYIDNCPFVEAIITYFHCNRQKLSCQPLGWSKKKWRAVQFIRLVEVYFIEQNSPAFYASHLNLAQPYLREICKKELTQPPCFWINLRRIAAASLLLLNGSLQIKEIAYQVGFDDVSYFIRLFKKYMGMTPNAFRKMVVL